ncbi:MAG: hypothetical protein LBT47_04630 [Deltaproteobacteria bacterium]|jgi:hypothetical protein|nr:hypothetical protein [Deltaproteobacteria bacterium]
MLRHVIKLSLLGPGLAFLIWWGWSGNFAFNYGDLFWLAEQETFYRLYVGGRASGWARRTISKEPDSGNMEITEQSLLDLKIGEMALGLKTESKTVFSSRGRLISASFSVPLGDQTASAEAVVDRDRLVSRLSFGKNLREASFPVPPNGPLVVSGIVPWLGHQRDMPLGRALGVELFDPVSMSFKSGQLTIEEDTAQSEEIQTFKLTLKFMSAESTEWVDSNGQRLRQYNQGLDTELVLVQDPSFVDQAKEALAGPIPNPIDKDLVGFLEQALAGYGLEALSGLSNELLSD